VFDFFLYSQNTPPNRGKGDSKEKLHHVVISNRLWHKASDSVRINKAGLVMWLFPFKRVHLFVIITLRLSFGNNFFGSGFTWLGFCIEIL
jgi:hypothetical protein